jgi:DNA topoisomerase-1
MSDISPNVEAAREDARQNGLRYLGDDRPGLGRARQGEGFTYRDAAGTAISDEAALARIKRLAIPPAWTDVWISPAANGHLQATGRDARGRKQYRYHPDFRAARDRTKYEHVLEFGSHIENIRRRVDADMRRTGLPREKVVATIVHLLDTTLIRVGNDEYARANGSFGLTTLRNKHVKIDGGELRFEFKGKSGKAWRLAMQDRRVAKIVKSCQELPGQHLFQYLDENGELQSVGSADVNAYLQEITGADVTAKDFRTFAGTVLAAAALLRFKPFESATEAKVNVRAAIEEVAERLGNTPAVCRSCYIHPEIMTAYVAGALSFRAGRPRVTSRKTAALSDEERAVLRFLKARMTSGKRSRPSRARSTGEKALAA